MHYTNPKAEQQALILIKPKSWCYLNAAKFACQSYAFSAILHDFKHI